MTSIIDRASLSGLIAVVVLLAALVRAFYSAEKYHQDVLVRNPSHPYILYNDLPKIENLKRLFPGLFRAAPVLVGR